MGTMRSAPPRPQAAPTSNITQGRSTEFGVSSTTNSFERLIANRIRSGMSSPPSISRSSRNVDAPDSSIFSHSVLASHLSAVAWLTKTWYGFAVSFFFAMPFYRFEVRNVRQSSTGQFGSLLNVSEVLLPEAIIFRFRRTHKKDCHPHHQTEI